MPAMKHARDLRAKQLAAIHLGAATLGMDTTDQNPDSEYRSMLWALGRVRSAKDLDFAGRKAVLDHLKSRGAFHGEHRRPNPEWGWIDRASEDRRPMLKKIIMLAKSGGYGKRYVDGTCAHMFGIERLEMMAPDQLHALIAALMKHQARHPEKQHGS